MNNAAWNKRLFDTCRLRNEVPRDKKFGVEIECEGIQRLPDVAFGWNCIPDGSLRGEGKEYVTHGAVTRRHLETLMAILQEKLTGKVNLNAHRASTHIHYNMQHHTLQEIVGAIICFQMVEPVFMRLCGPNRDGNLFCLPSYDCGDMPEYCFNMAEHIEMHGTIQHLDHRGKYASMNTMPLLKFGTLEFRSFPCSIDREEVLKWADRVDMIIRRGAAMKNLKFEVERFYEHPMNIYQDIFTPREMDKFNPREIREMSEHGAESAWDCAIGVERGIKKATKYLEDLKKAQAAQDEYAKAQLKRANAGYLGMGDWGDPVELQVDEDDNDF